MTVLYFDRVITESSNYFTILSPSNPHDSEASVLKSAHAWSCRASIGTGQVKINRSHILTHCRFRSLFRVAQLHLPRYFSATCSPRYFEFENPLRYHVQQTGTRRKRSLKSFDRRRVSGQGSQRSQRTANISSSSGKPQENIHRYRRSAELCHLH